MNRKIKFRGLHIHVASENVHLNGTWVHGYLCGGGHYIEPNEGIEKLIDCDTVGQFTGLTDKNGKEIYEGDIILAGYYKWKSKVVWDEKCARFIGLTNDKDVNIVYVDMVDKDDKSAVEVIGNIYENPELLLPQN